MYDSFTKSSVVTYAPRQYLEYVYPIAFSKSFNIDSDLWLFNGSSALQKFREVFVWFRTIPENCINPIKQ